MRRRAAVACAVVLTLLAGVARTSAGEDSESKQAAGPEFRRIFVPADQLKDLPRDQVRYVPMKADEFERELAKTRAAGAGVPNIVAQIASAQYHARLAPDGVLQGEAILRIVHDADGEVMLPLEPCGLAITEAEWVGEEPRPAELGLATNGKIVAVVSKPGELRLGWSLRGARDSYGGLLFPLELPACPSNTLLLDLPSDLTPSITPGIALRESPENAAEARWRLSLGGHPRVELSISPGRGPEDRRPLTLVRQFLVYDLSLRGLELSAELRLDVHQEPLRQLTVALDPGLELVTAKYGESAISWSILSRPTKDQGARVLLELPEPIQGIGRVVRLGAVAPLVTGRKWRLPGCRAEGTAWQEGSATLAIRSPLKLQQLVPVHGRQSKTAALSATGPGESAEIQYFSEDAAAEVVVARQSASVQAVSGTTVELRGGEITGQVVAQFQVAEGDVFLLEAEVGRQWLIDSVQPEPPDVLGDGWSVRRDPDGTRRLVVRLGKAVSPLRPVRLIVAGRRLQSPLGRALSVADLTPLKFLHIESSRQLVAVHTLEPYRLKVEGAGGLSRMEPGSLSTEERQLFHSPPHELLFENNAKAGDLRLSLETPKPTYSADIRVEATVAGQTLTESYELRVVPETRVDRLLVHFSQPRPEPPTWTMPGGEDSESAARRLSATEQAAAGLDVKGETWEITLRRAEISPLEILAERRTGLESGQAISLACLPQAAGQEGILLVRSSEGVRIDNARLEPAPLPAVPPEKINTARAAFRYQPGSDAVNADEPVVAVSAESPMLPLAWAWNCEFESRYQANGTGRHTAIYRIESHGKRELVLLLPPCADSGKEISVWIGSRRASWRRPESSRGGVVVDLPAGLRFPAVVVQFVTQPDRDALAGAIDPPVPAADIPVLSHNWTVWLPPGYAVADQHGVAAIDRNPSLTWTQRLFGPFGRPAHHGPVRLGDADPAFVPVDRRPSEPEEPKSPWTILSEIGDDPLDTLGWTVHPIELGCAEPVRLVVVHEDSYRSLAWVIFLATTAVSWWIGRRRPAALATVLALAVATALIVPQRYCPMASGVVLGVFAGLGFLVVRMRPANEDRQEDTSCGSSTMVGPAVVHGSVAVLGLVAAGLTSPAIAGDSPAGPAPRVVHNVLIPVDDQEKPVGGIYQVPEAFYQELRRRSAALSEEPQGWLLRGATYRATLARQTAAAQLVMAELKAAYDIEVFGRSVRVRIPLSREGANLPPEGVTLDGRVIQPEWQEADGTLAIEIIEPGPYRLEVTLRPTPQNIGAQAGIDLRIPRLATSRLEVNLPPDAPAVEVLSAKGAVIRQQTPPRLLAELGSSDRLTVRWPGSAGGDPAVPAADIETLLWLQIHPGSVVLNARIKLKVLEGAVRQVQLSADPRLRLLPLRDTGGPIGRIQVTPGQPQQIQLELSSPVNDQAVVEVSFLLTGASGIGNLRLPHLEVEDLRVTRRWMAVSVDPALVYEQEGTDSLEAIPPPEFTSAWGKAESQPAFAYRLGTGQPDWILATRPDEPHVTVDQVLALSFAPGTSHVRLDAQLATTGYSFQYRLSVPAALEIEKISIRELSIERATRWTRDAQGGITVFLNGPASGNQHLSLQGKLPVPARGTMPLPQIRVEGTEMRSCEIQLFREPSVLVDVAKTVGLEEVEPPIVSQERAPFARLVQWFTVTDCRGTVGAELAISPNRPEVIANQLTYVYSSSGKWAADVEYHVVVRRGVVDEFRLRVPPQWSGPHQTTAAATLARIDSPDQRELVIRPRLAVEGQYRFRVSGPLEFSAGQRVAAPDIRLLDAKKGRSLLVLPTRSESGQTSWEVRGLSEVAIPEDLAVPPAAREWLVAYQVENDAFQALLDPAAGSSRTPAVLLSDIRVVWRADGSYRQLAAFDVDPAGTSQCLLSVPASMELVDLRVAGVPSVPRSEGESEWSFSFASAAPQRVEVLAVGRLPGRSGDGTCRLEAPRLGPLSVARTLWTVSGPKEFVPRLPEGVEPVEAIDLDVLRLKSVISCANLALTDRRRAAAAGQWCEAWLRYGAIGRDRATRQLVNVGASDRVEAITAELESLDRQLAELARSGGVPPQPSPNAEMAAVISSQLWLEVERDSATAAHYVSTPGAAAITVPYTQAAAEPRFPRLLLAIACIALVPLTWMGWLRRRASQLCCRWPAAVGVMVGLGWWLWLEPSVLGWAIVAATLLLELFPIRRRPSYSAVIVVPLNQNSP